MSQTRAPVGTLEPVIDPSSYAERRSATPGLTVWTRVADGSMGWILPDGCLDVLWDGEWLSVAGPDTGARAAEARRGTSFAAVRFDSGVGPAVLERPADAVRDQQVALSELLPHDDVERLADELRAADRPDRHLEQWAADRLVRSPGPDATMRRVAGLLAEGERVGDVAESVGIGERQLHRRALAAFGYGPKVLARILRLQRALALARSGTPLARTAAEVGYADQAHLAREVRALAGRPLTELLIPRGDSGPST
jgi:AraC-like DNA-binding protein